MRMRGRMGGGLALFLLVGCASLAGLDDYAGPLDPTGSGAGGATATGGGGTGGTGAGGMGGTGAGGGGGIDDSCPAPCTYLVTEAGETVRIPGVVALPGGGAVVIAVASAGSGPEEVSQSYVIRLRGDGTEAWRQGLTGPDRIEVAAVDVDPNSGDILVGGSYRGDLTAAPGLTVSSTQYDAFVARYDAAGEVLYARSYGGSQHQEIHDLVVLQSGETVVVGEFRGSLNFVTNMQAGMSDDGFIAVLDPLGDATLEHQLGDPLDTDDHQILRVDELPGVGVFVGGVFQNAVQLGPFGHTTATATELDLFFAAYDLVDEDYVRSISYRGTGDETLHGMAVDGGFAYPLVGFDDSLNLRDNNVIAVQSPGTAELALLGIPLTLSSHNQTPDWWVQFPAALPAGAIVDGVAASLGRIVVGAREEGPMTFATADASLTVDGVDNGARNPFALVVDSDGLAVDGYAWEASMGGLVQSVSLNAESLYVGGAFEGMLQAEGQDAAASTDEDGFVLRRPAP